MMGLDFQKRSCLGERNSFTGEIKVADSAIIMVWVWQLQAGLLSSKEGVYV